MFIKGNSFTHPEFEEITGSWRLSAVICILRKLGWPVESKDISAPSKNCQHRKISRYYLPPKIIQAVLGGV